MNEKKICTLKGAKSIVMKRVWEKANDLEKNGASITPKLFGELEKKEWLKARDEINKLCRAKNIEDELIEEPLDEETSETKPIEKTEDVTIEEESEEKPNV